LANMDDPNKKPPGPPYKPNYLPRGTDFPHEFQETPYSCGAATFTMAYRSLGHDILQKDVLKKVTVTRTGGPTCIVWLEILDSLSRGFDTLYLRAVNPLEMIKSCLKNNVRAITHERAYLLSVVGHSTLIVGIDEEHVYQHCPSLGPNQATKHNHLLELMASVGNMPSSWGNRITLISNPISEKYTCQVCGKEIPEFVTCPHCNKIIRLAPAAPLGCFEELCIGRAWMDITCPWCFKGIRQLYKPSEEEGMPQEEFEKSVAERKKQQEETVLITD